ncbi:MAG: signal peptide peptidase SppA [Vibrio sp.]
MKSLFRFVGLLLKGIWKTLTFIRLALTNLFFLLTIGIIYFIYTQADAPLPSLNQSSALVLNLSGPIVEQNSQFKAMDSFAGSAFGDELPRENVLFDIVETLRHAKNDTKITGLVLALADMPETNLTKLRYIAKAINEFKSSGKPVYAVGDFYNQSQYYLASYADKIYLAPDGAVLLKGYSAYSMYYKTLLEKLEVSTHVFRVGTYKSAIEPFIRDDMSDEARESASRWLTQLWSAYLDDVASNRQIEITALTPSMDEFVARLKAVGGDLAALSQQVGLVDELATRQQMRQALSQTFGSDGKDSYNAISYYEYQASIKPAQNNAASDIAVVVASGAIMDGSQPRGSIGGDTVAGLLREARNDNKIKAVVLRVDSPGGSAFASEVIRNEMEALQAAGKPVVVSMSSLAASGGYWISMSADKIVAQPTTLTGSIGIFSVITTFEKGLNQLGIYTDGVGTTPFAGQGLTTGLTQGAKEAIQLGIEHGYQRFISLVAEKRGLSIQAVDEIAQGRVWTAQDALNLGLIDQLGDFDDAVRLAADLAKLEQYNLYWVEEPLSPIQQFLQDLLGQVRINAGLDIAALWPKSLQPLLGEWQQQTHLLNQLNDPKGQYAFCLPCQVE